MIIYLLHKRQEQLKIKTIYKWNIWEAKVLICSLLNLIEKHLRYESDVVYDFTHTCNWSSRLTFWSFSLHNQNIYLKSRLNLFWSKVNPAQEQSFLLSGGNNSLWVRGVFKGSLVSVPPQLPWFPSLLIHPVTMINCSPQNEATFQTLFDEFVSPLPKP